MSIKEPNDSLWLRLVTIHLQFGQFLGVDPCRDRKSCTFLMVWVKAVSSWSPAVRPSHPVLGVGHDAGDRDVLCGVGAHSPIGFQAVRLSVEVQLTQPHHRSESKQDGGSTDAESGFASSIGFVAHLLLTKSDLS